MQVPTNYKMGSGLAGAIMGQQTALDQEKMGLENIYKGMQMPGEILKGQEQAMLLQDPNYLQQKTANTMIELSNTYKANEFQATLNEVGRAELALQASGGDPKTLYPYLEKMGIPQGDPLWAAVEKNPQQVLQRYREGLEAMIARTGGAKYQGEIAKQTAADAAHMARTEKEIAGRDRNAALQAGATITAARIGGEYKDLAQLGNAIKDASTYVQSLQNNLTKLNTEEGKNEAINLLISSQGLSKEQATTAVNSGAYKDSVQKDLTAAKAQYEHLKKQSPYYAGYDFGQQTPPPTTSTPAPSTGKTSGGAGYTIKPQGQPEPVPAQAQTPAPIVQPQPTPEVQPTPTSSISYGAVNPAQATQPRFLQMSPESRGYVPGSGNQTLHDRNAQRRQAQIDTLKRQEAEAVLEVTKWEARGGNSPYARSKLQEAQQNLVKARENLAAIQ